MAQGTLPQEIILLVCDELTLRRDFPTLFQLSLVSRRVASIALEKLYSIHELSPVSTGDTANRQAWARLWKSIIRSSIGETAFPYCTYIHELSLGNLEDLFDYFNTSGDHRIRSWLFNPADNMDRFLVLRDFHLKRASRKRTVAAIDVNTTMVAWGESITNRIKEVADQSETAIVLARLEAKNLPKDLLPSWISRLGALTSLQIHHGAVLDAEAGSAISGSCPKFSELRCYDCTGANADADMAAFLQTLRPNTLQHFEVISVNALSRHTLNALNSHAQSLKVLKLGSMSSEALKNLNALPDCTALETLSIENNRHDQVDLKTFSDGLLKEIIAWIQDCKGLLDLTFTHVQDALLIIKDVLDSSQIRLNSLTLHGFSHQSPAHTFAAWSALGTQDALENLTLGLQDGTIDGLMIHESPPLAASICKLENLKSLNLIHAFARITDLQQFTATLTQLVDLRFHGDFMDDSILDSLVTLRNLKVLVVSAFSQFTPNALEEFARNLHASDHQGMRFDILNQLGEYKLSEQQQNQLSDYFASVLEGRFEIGYFQDPDELHESDFSIESD